MKLTRNTSVTIVLPAVATKREEFAAQELSKYLNIIFPGISVQIAADNEEHAGKRILIGGPERNQAVAAYICEDAFDTQVPGPEGIFIKSYGSDTLILAGSSKHPNERERGTLYAVYELLERYLGCSFAAFVNPHIAGGELIPTLEEADLSEIEYIKECADNPYRAGITEYSAGNSNVKNPLSNALIDWMAKNRFNRIVTWTLVYEQMKQAGTLEELDRRGILITAGHHSAPGTFLPPHGNEYFPEHYYETHPEYYKLLENGERFNAGTDGDANEIIGGQWIFCSTNDDLIRVLAENVAHYVDLNPQIDTIALWPQDFCRPQCVCPECSKYTKTENYTRVFNGVAKRLAKDYPHIKLDLLAYSDVYECPQGIKMESNVFVEAATSYRGADDRLRKIGNPDGSGLIDSIYEKLLLQWKDAGAQVGYYDYCMGVHAKRQRYIPCADEMQSFWKRYREVGIQGSGTQMEYFNFWNHIFNFYCFARTGYDTALSMENNLVNFTKIFGEGAPYIADAIRTAEACLNGQVNIRWAGLYLMENIDKGAMYSLCEKALAAASTPFARNNIRMYRMGFRYSDIECEQTRIEKDKLPYSPMEKCADPTGELHYMSTHFDSRFWNPDLGYGIAIPVDCEEGAYTPDHWYTFEA